MIFACCAISKAQAQSTVYLIYDVQFWNKEVPIKINGDDAFNLIGATRTIGGIVFYGRCTKKCTLYSEGKTILSFDFSVELPTNGIVVPYSDEIHLNLFEGSVHYVKIKAQMKGNPIVFEELSEEDGIKEFSLKKYTQNHDYIQPQ